MFDILPRGQMAEGTVRPTMVVVVPPCFDLAPGVFDGQELLYVETFIA